MLQKLLLSSFLFATMLTVQADGKKNTLSVVQKNHDILVRLDVERLSNTDAIVKEIATLSCAHKEVKNVLVDLEGIELHPLKHLKEIYLVLSPPEAVENLGSLIIHGKSEISLEKLAQFLTAQKLDIKQEKLEDKVCYKWKFHAAMFYAVQLSDRTIAIGGKNNLIKSLKLIAVPGESLNNNAPLMNLYKKR